MPERLTRNSAGFGEYTSYHITTTQTDAQIDGSTHGHFFRGIIIGNGAATQTIKVGNGTTVTPANVMAIITPNASAVFYPFDCAFDRGIWLAITGSGTIDYTVVALPMAV